MFLFLLLFQFTKLLNNRKNILLITKFFKHLNKQIKNKVKKMPYTLNISISKKQQNFVEKHKIKPSKFFQVKINELIEDVKNGKKIDNELIRS